MKLWYTAGAAILAGFLLWMFGLVKPLWRSAAVVGLAAIAASYLAPCCESCEKQGPCVDRPSIYFPPHR